MRISVEESLDIISSILQLCNHTTEIIELEDTGNGASLKQCYALGKDSGYDLIFFVEDDYLHDINVIDEMIVSYNMFSGNLPKEVGMFPCDYPDNYTRPEFFNVPSFIALGKSRHWRTVSNATCTFLCTRKLINDHWELFDKMSYYGESGISEDTTLNNIWRQAAFLFAPMPSLSVHLHENTTSAFINLQDMWRENEFSTT